MESNSSLLVAQAIASSVKTLLGPSQSVKCIVDENEEIICSDAAKLLQYLDIQHPAGFIINDACQGMHKKYGTGCKTLVCMIGSLSRAAADLIAQGIPVPAISRLNDEALSKCMEVMEETEVPLHCLQEGNITKISHRMTEEDILSSLSSDLGVALSHEKINKGSLETVNSPDDTEVRPVLPFKKITYSQITDDIEGDVEDLLPEDPGCFSLVSHAEMLFKTEEKADGSNGINITNQDQMCDDISTDSTFQSYCSSEKARHCKTTKLCMDDASTSWRSSSNEYQFEESTIEKSSTCLLDETKSAEISMVQNRTSDCEDDEFKSCFDNIAEISSKTSQTTVKKRNVEDTHVNKIHKPVITDDSIGLRNSIKTSQVKDKKQNKSDSGSKRLELAATEKMLEALAFISNKRGTKKLQRHRPDITRSSRHLASEERLLKKGNAQSHSMVDSNHEMNKNSSSVERKENLDILARMLTGENSKETQLAIKVVHSQLSILREDNELNVNTDLIHVEPVVGPSSCISRVVDGILLKKGSGIGEAFPQDDNLRAVLVNGDITEVFCHVGYKDSFQARREVTNIDAILRKTTQPQTWLEKVISVLRSFHIGVIFSKGEVDESVLEFCRASSIAVFQYVPYSILQLLSSSTGSSSIVYLTDIQEEDIGRCVTISRYGPPEFLDPLLPSWDATNRAPYVLVRSSGDTGPAGYSDSPLSGCDDTERVPYADDLGPSVDVDSLLSSCDATSRVPDVLDRNSGDLGSPGYLDPLISRCDDTERVSYTDNPGPPEDVDSLLSRCDATCWVPDVLDRSSSGTGQPGYLDPLLSRCDAMGRTSDDPRSPEHFDSLLSNYNDTHMTSYTVIRNCGDPLERSATPSSVPLQTVLLCAPSKHLLSQTELAFRRAVCRLRNALSCGKVLPGAGKTEIACVAALEKYAGGVDAREHPSSLSSSSWLEASLPTYRPVVYCMFASAIRDFLTSVMINCGHAHYDAVTRIESKVNETANKSKTADPLLLVDDYTAKREAWRRAVGVVRLLLQTDMCVVTGIQDAALRDL